jgi:hypothetical protein
MKNTTYYFSHDYNARNDRKMIRMRQKLKMEGVGVYWSLIEMLYEDGGKISLSDVPSIADELRVKEGMLDQLITSFGLFDNDGQVFWSDSVKRRLDKRLEKSEKARESVRKRWQNTNVLRTNYDSNTIKESKGKESKGNIVVGAIAPPSYKNWGEEEFKSDIAKYLDDFGRDACNAFFKYWSEKSASGKMKFQLERTWETKKRLETWQRRAEENYKKAS